MTVFTTIVTPADLHDLRFQNPSSVSPTVQYQIPPTSIFTLYHLQQYINDITALPNKTHSKSLISFSISNGSLSDYKSARLLKHHIDILWENSKIKRIDLDFSHFKFRNGIIPRVISFTNHIQKHNEYNIFLSISIPLNKQLKIPDEFLILLTKFKDEFINFNMINFLITKDFKRKDLTWLETTKEAHKNIIKQLKDYDESNEIFIGFIEKYIGFTFDCDIIPCKHSIEFKSIDSSTLKYDMRTAVKQSMKHGEKKNMSELDFLQIWKWANRKGIGQIQVKSYLLNSKNIKKIIEKNYSILNNIFFNSNNDNLLLLPKDFLFKVADEVGNTNITSSHTYYNTNLQQNESIRQTTNQALMVTNNNNIVNNSHSQQNPLPDYETAMFEKVLEHEIMMNSLLKLPSYKTGAYI